MNTPLGSLCRSLSSFRRSIAAIAGALVLGLSGCASIAGGYDLVTKNDAPLYLQGPGQEVPDTYLDKGTRVKIIQAAGGYARVETTRGVRGFVRVSDLEKGPEQAGASGGNPMGSAGMF